MCQISLEEPYTQNSIEEFQDGQFEALLCVFQHLVQDGVNTAGFLGLEDP